MALRHGLRKWDEVFTQCVNGSDAEQLFAAMERHPYQINWDAKVGQLGIWYTVLNAMEHAPVVTFEDDALLAPMFEMNWQSRIRYLPEDFDFFSLFLPRDSDHMWKPEMAVNKFITRVYQRYGGVSMYYSENGVQKIKALLERDGLTGQYDDTLYMYAKSGELNGYTSLPSLMDLVYITGMEESIVQESEFWTGKNG
jgi:hypothetical protein